MMRSLLLKRLFDMAASGIGLLLLAPLLLVLAAWIKCDSAGPVFFLQERVGLCGKLFRIIKFRSMRQHHAGPQITVGEDARITRSGRFIRAYKLDELPQLINVLLGDMSLVGPRPERPELVAKYAAEEPLYRLRHLLKPGLTGLAQVMGAYATKPDVKLRYDLGYLFHWSPVLDLFVLARTVTTVLRVSGV